MTSNIVVIKRVDSTFLHCLSGRELAKYQTLSEQSRKDFLAGRVALKNAFLNYKGISAKSSDKVIINNLDNGQPMIIGEEQVYCSIGHSYGWGIGAVATCRIGVDIEKVRPHQKALLRYISSPKEIGLVRNFFGKSTNYITLIWVIKEAVLKGLGTGFGVSPRQVKISRQINQEYFSVEGKGLRPKLWRVWPFRKDNFYISIAYENNYEQKPRINWNCWSCV
jgi:phosphopantetheinyl transferase